MKFSLKTKTNVADQAEQLINAKEYEEAIQLLEAALDKGDVSADNYYWLGRARYFNCEENKSLILFNKALGYRKSLLLVR